MISIGRVKYICSEDPSLIENYDKAVADQTNMWVCHHRLETDKRLSSSELKKQGMYYKRPANELIFLTKKDHSDIHKENPYLETRKKRSEAMKGEKNPCYGRTGEKNPMYGKHLKDLMTEEAYNIMRKKQAESNKGENNPCYGKNPEDAMTPEAIALKRKRMSESAKKRWAKIKNTTE